MAGNAPDACQGLRAVGIAALGATGNELLQAARPRAATGRAPVAGAAWDFILSELLEREPFDTTRPRWRLLDMDVASR